MKSRVKPQSWWRNSGQKTSNAIWDLGTLRQKIQFIFVHVYFTDFIYATPSAIIYGEML